MMWCGGDPLLRRRRRRADGGDAERRHNDEGGNCGDSGVAKPRGHSLQAGVNIRNINLVAEKAAAAK